MRFRRWPAPQGIAHLRVYADDDVARVAWPTWDGDVDALVHLPSAAFDEQFNCTRLHVRQQALDQFEEFIETAYFSHQVSGVLWPNTPPITSEQPLGETPAAVMTTVLRLDYPRQRLWAKSEFEPEKSRDFLLSTGHRIYWNWVVSVLHFYLDALEPLLNNLRHQADYYQLQRVTRYFRMKNMGKASFYGAMAGSGNRFWGEVAAFAGITPEELSALPEVQRRAIRLAYAEGRTEETLEETLESLLRKLEGDP